MKTSIIVTLFFLIVGCNYSPKDPHAKPNMSPNSSQNFWEYLSNQPDPRDTVDIFAKFLMANPNYGSLETAYLRDMIFDSILSRSKETREHYFSTSTIALEGEAQFSPLFNSNLCKLIKANPKEFIELINSCNRSRISTIGQGIGNYFSYYLKTSSRNPEIINLLLQTAKTMDSVSVLNTEYLISNFDPFYEDK